MKKLTHYALFLVFFLNFQQSINATETDKDKKLNTEITDWQARLEYARLLSNLQRYEDALKQFQLLLNEKPDSSDVQVEIAQIYYYQGNQQEALRILDNIPPEKINLKTSVLIADINVAMKNYSKAESIYRSVLRETPDDDALKFKLAELLSWQQEYDESIELYRNILMKNPNDIQLRRKYAMVLLWMGEEEEAANELEKTLK